MITVVYTPSFVREFNKLPKALQEEIKERIAIFEQDPRNPMLKTHKLRGKLRKYWSFSVNYRCRIVFEHDSKTRIALLSVGGHNVYHKEL